MVTILGGTAVGKSTLGRALGQNTDYIEEPEITQYGRAVTTVFANGCGVVGNYGSGTDVISVTTARLHVTEMLLADERVKFVVANSARTSGPTDVDWVCRLPVKNLAAVYVFINVSYEENLRRLQMRRDAKGKNFLTDVNRRNAKSFWERAQRVWNYAKTRYTRQPVVYLELYDKDTVAASVKKVLAAVKKVQSL